MLVKRSAAFVSGSRLGSDDAHEAPGPYSMYMKSESLYC
jgi:hypothetical protein